MAKTAAEIIGFVLGQDMAEVTEGRYRPTQITDPAVYVVGTDYYCAPAKGRKPHASITGWAPYGEAYGRTVYRAQPATGSIAAPALRAELAKLRAVGILVEERHFEDGYVVRRRFSEDRAYFDTAEQALAAARAMVEGNRNA